MEIIARYNNHRATYRHPARHRQAVQIFVPLKMRGKSKGRADGELNSKRGGIKTGLRSNCIFYISMSPHTPAAGSGAGATPVSSMVWYGMVRAPALDPYADHDDDGPSIPCMSIWIADSDECVDGRLTVCRSEW